LRIENWKKEMNTEEEKLNKEVFQYTIINPKGRKMTV